MSQCSTNASPIMNVGQDLLDLSSEPDSLRSGIIRVRGLGTWTKWWWKRRRLILVDSALIIQHSQTDKVSQHSVKRIPLHIIAKIERLDLAPACLMLEDSYGRQYFLSFQDDATLYDWQDDIYPRSRLGNISSPSNFIHEVHLTTTDIYRHSHRLSALRKRMSTTTTTPLPPSFKPRRSSVSTYHHQRPSSELSHAPTTTLHHQRQQSYDSCAKPSPSPPPPPPLEPLRLSTHTYHRRTSSASTTSTCKYVFDSSIHPTGCLQDSPPQIILEGLYHVKRVKNWPLFSFWRGRYVVLTSRSLEIRKSQASRPETTIRLPQISDVSELKLGRSKPFCLALTTFDNRKFYFSLPNSSDLRHWTQSIASRNRRLSLISPPQNFEFHVHVSWNPKTQTFVGLPDEWKKELEVQQDKDDDDDGNNDNKDRSTPPSPPASPLTPNTSPDKPIGPVCSMCYNSFHCDTCKLDNNNNNYCNNKNNNNNTTTGQQQQQRRRSPTISFTTSAKTDRRSRPFSVTSGTTLIGDHECYCHSHTHTRF